MTRTVLDIDRSLLTQAQQILGTASFTATLNEALRRIVARKALDDMINHFVNLDDEELQVLAHAKDQW